MLGASNGPALFWQRRVDAAFIVAYQPMSTHY